MEWKRVSPKEYVANGGKGKFVVCRIGEYWCSKYITAKQSMCFKLQPKRLLRAAQWQCEQNTYWES